MRRAAAMLAVAMLVACGGRDAQNVTTADASTTSTVAVKKAAALTPEQLGELGAQIRKEPARAQEILAAHALDPQSFEKAIRAVTEDAEASKRYAAAYRRASS